MTNSNLYLYTGPVNSGKTSRLNQWLRAQNDVAGILAPKINGRRHLRDLSTGETRLLETDFVFDSENVIKVGDFNFYKKIFEWGRNILKEAFDKKPEWLIIDEIGFLEMEGQGLSPEASDIINNHDEIPSTNVLVIVRSALLEDFFEKYDLSEDSVTYFTLSDEDQPK